jgi:hypothetical protein
MSFLMFFVITIRPLPFFIQPANADTVLLSALKKGKTS